LEVLGSVYLCGIEVEGLAPIDGTGQVESICTATGEGNVLRVELLSVKREVCVSAYRVLSGVLDGNVYL
jgi:hypothetical protein